MIEFQCDYAEGAHPKILERLVETNTGPNPRVWSGSLL